MDNKIPNGGFPPINICSNNKLKKFKKERLYVNNNNTKNINIKQIFNNNIKKCLNLDFYLQNNDKLLEI